MQTPGKHSLMAVLMLFLLHSSALDFVAGADEKKDQKMVKEHSEIYAELQQGEHVAAWQRYSLIGVPQVKTPPVIDGVVDNREWAGTSQIGHMLDMSNYLMVPDQVKVLLCYTETHLYLAFRVSRPEGVRTPSDNDYFEILFDVLHAHQRYCDAKLGLNGVLSDGIGPNVDPNAWNPTWAYKARVTEFGWEGEAAIAFKDFPGCAAAPKPGTIWGADFVRNERSPVERLANWSIRSRWHATKDLAHLMFTGQPVAFRVENAGWQTDLKQIGIKVAVANDSDQTVELDAFLELRRAGEKQMMPYFQALDSALTEDLGVAIGAVIPKEVKQAQTPYAIVKEAAPKIKVPPHTSKLVELVEPDQPGHYLVSFSIKEKDQLLAAMTVPFIVTIPLDISLRSYLYSANTLAYTIDLRRVQDKLSKDSVLKVTATIGKEGKPAATQEHRDLPNKSEITGELRVDPTPGAICMVTATVTDGKTAVVRNEAPLAIPPKAEWISNSLGKKKFVPKPWTPLKATAQTTETLTIRYGWPGKSLFPAISVLGREYLAAPIRLIMKDGQGQEMPLTITTFSLKESDIEQALYTFQAQVGAMGTLEGTAKIEFDGFLWYDLVFTPNSSAELGGCTLEIPLKPDCARLYTRARMDVLYDGNKKVPGEEAGRVPPEGMALPFVFQVWLGHEEGGLQWLAENKADWFNGQPDQVIRIEPEKTATSLVVRFIDKKVKVSRPLKWSFGFQPTPGRIPGRGMQELSNFQFTGLPELGPVDESETNAWKKAKAKRNYEWTIGGGAANAGVKTVTLFSSWNEMFGYPGTQLPETAEKLRQVIKHFHKQGIKVLVYAGWGISTQCPEWKDYGWEMVKLPLKNSGYSTYWAYPATLYPDLYVYRLAEMIRLYDLDGVFMDNTLETVYSLNYNGMRWVNEKGEVQGSYGLRAMREFCKRVYKVLHGEVKENGVFIGHHSSPADAWIENFTDVHQPSEFAQMYDGELDETFLDFFIAKNAGTPFGLHAMLTNKNWMKGITKTVNQLNAICIPLNIDYKAVNPAAPQDYSLRGEPMPKIWQAKAWLDSAKAEYLPWWKNSAYISTSPHDQVLTAIWLRKGEKALVCVSNLNKAPRTIETTLQFEKMGFAAAQVEDAVTGEKIPLEKNTLKLSVDFERFRLLKITGQK